MSRYLPELTSFEQGERLLRSDEFIWSLSLPYGERDERPIASGEEDFLHPHLKRKQRQAIRRAKRTTGRMFPEADRCRQDCHRLRSWCPADFEHLG